MSTRGIRNRQTLLARSNLKCRGRFGGIRYFSKRSRDLKEEGDKAKGLDDKGDKVKEPGDNDSVASGYEGEGDALEELDDKGDGAGEPAVPLCSTLAQSLAKEHEGNKAGEPAVLLDSTLAQSLAEEHKDVTHRVGDWRWR